MCRYIFLLLSMAFISCFADRQADTIRIETKTISRQQLLDKQKELLYPGKPFYEDEKYLVTISGTGEVNGDLYFLNKQTRSTHWAEIDCPIAVNRLKDHYLVITGTKNMGGFTRVLQINDPDSLVVVDSSEREKVIAGTGGDTPAERQTAIVSIIDSVDIDAIGGFIYDDTPYLLISGNGKTVLAGITDQKKMMTIKTLLNEPVWKADTPIYVAKNNGWAIFFYTDNTKGYFEINGNTLTVNKINRR
jgi:hypothetical protein